MAQTTVHKRPENHEEKVLLLEQYKAFQGRITVIISDRTTTNKFLLAVLSGLITISVYLSRLTQEGRPDWFPQRVAIMFAIHFLGGLISWWWIRWTETFDEALRAGYRLLGEMEQHLPARPFFDELPYRKEAARKQHMPSSAFHRAMARIFLVINALVAIVLLVVLFLIWSPKCLGPG